MIPRTSRSVGIGLALSLALALPLQAQTVLRYQLKKGDTLHYAVEEKTSTRLSSKAINAESTAVQFSDLLWTVKGVDKDGQATIAVKLERLRLTVDDGRNRFEYDSLEGREPQGRLGQLLAPTVKAVAGLEYDMTLDPRGKVGGIRISPKSQEAITAGANSPGLEEYTPDSLAAKMSQMIPVLAAAPVKPGATWKNVVESKTPFGNMKLEQVLKFKGDKTEQGHADIGLQGTVSLGENVKTPIKVKAQTGAGTATFDLASGRLLTLSGRQTMSLEITINGQDVTQEIRQSLGVSLKK